MDRVRPRHRVSPWVVVLLVALVNLPLVHSTWLDHRVASSGVETTAAVIDHVERDGDRVVYFEYGRDVDPDASEPVYSARLDEAAYDRAVASDVVEVRVLRDRPSAYDVHGQVGGHGLLVGTLALDALLLVVAGLFLAARRGRGPDDELLHLVAVEDVARCRPGSGLERLDATTYVVTGEISLLDDTGLEVDVAGRRVRVDLDGHANPAGYQQPVRVTARLAC